MSKKIGMLDVKDLQILELRTAALQKDRLLAHGAIENAKRLLADANQQSALLAQERVALRERILKESGVDIFTHEIDTNTGEAIPVQPPKGADDAPKAEKLPLGETKDADQSPAGTAG